MAAINNLRRRVIGEIFDYQQLIDCLSEYAKPRDKITAMLEAGEIIRVKKGLYVFGRDYRRRPWSRENVANLIYGPSYISLDYALSHYGFIPEGVLVVTSVTISKARKFETPLGMFTYRSLSMRKYDIGIDQQSGESDQPYLIATPAKALADKVWTDTRCTPRKAGDFEAYLLDDLRIDTDALGQLDLFDLSTIADRYGSRKIRLLRDYVEGMA